MLRSIAVKKLKCFWRHCENSGEKMGEGTAVIGKQKRGRLDTSRAVDRPTEQRPKRDWN